ISYHHVDRAGHQWILQYYHRQALYTINPSVLFGRDERSSMLGDSRIHSRGWDSMAPQFWSMAVPQRFGRKK
uniref:Uncharacterized protein n=1 Tax=Xenopus tropicalis TaxID=8364 RepID=A0A6I8R7H7_XENTR